MRTFLRCAWIVSLMLPFTSYSDGEFGEAQARNLLSHGTKQLDGEQVVLQQGQVGCGVREELWTYQALGESRGLGRLTEKGRALNFADDVQVEADANPFVQVRGQLPIQVSQVVQIRDENASTKIVEARVAVKINHPCFGNPLPLMGVRHGQFTANSPARFQLALNETWEYDRILH